MGSAHISSVGCDQMLHNVDISAAVVAVVAVNDGEMIQQKIDAKAGFRLSQKDPKRENSSPKIGQNLLSLLLLRRPISHRLNYPLTPKAVP